MLNIQEVVNFLNEQLNTDENISINVKAEIGESDKESLISGILRTAQAKTTPIANYVENRYSFVCELSVPTARTNKVFLKAQDIVSVFVDNLDGTKVDFTNGSGTINCSLGKPENFKVEYNVGDCTPLYFTIDMVYTESGVMSIQKKWYLSENGTTFYEIPYETESVVVNKEGITRKVDFDKYTKTLLTGQTKFYKFKFPYINNELGNMLMKDILNGDFKKQYTLKYVDGINYIEDDLTNPPFTTKVSLYMSGDLNSQVVNVGKFDVTFTDVDDGNTETKYYIGLINWQFDLSGEDTRWFKTQSEQQTYFTNLVTGTGGTGWQQIEAPNLNSIYITSQVFPNSATTKLNVFDLVRKNYAIIKVVTTSGQTTTTKYIYYGATNCQIGADGQVTYDLEEDTVQTLFMNSSLTFGGEFIERCHRNRFLSQSGNTGKYVYNFSASSSFFEKETIQSCAKRTTQKIKLNVEYDKNANGTMNSWMNTNVSHWVYVYLSSGEIGDNNNWLGKQYKWYKLNSSQQPVLDTGTLNELQYMNSQTGRVAWGGIICICYPVYKTSKLIYYKDTSLSIEENLTEFLGNNNGYANVYAIKNSIIPPFNMKDWVNDTNWVAGTDYEIDENNNFRLKTILRQYPEGISSGDIRSWGCSVIQTSSASIGMIYKAVQYLEENRSLYLNSTFYQNVFTAAQIKNYSYEPKIYNEDYSTYHIYMGGQTYDMPISKTSNKPAFKYYEPLTPDITKFYLAYDRTSTYTNDEFGSNSIFGAINTKDYTGLVGTLDLSMWFSKNKLDEYLATNKNNLQIFQNNQELSEMNATKNAFFGLAGAGVGMATGIATGNPVGVVGGLISGVQGISGYLSNTWQRETEATNRDLTLDNMRQSPASLSALNSNIILMQNVDEFGVYIELQKPIEMEENQIRDYLKRYGYTVNRNGSVRTYMVEGSSSYGLSRKNYVYIKAQLSAMSGVPISTQERMNLKQRFANGIRFWSTDTIEYTSNNYETYLDYV